MEGEGLEREKQGLRAGPRTSKYCVGCDGKDPGAQPFSSDGADFILAELAEWKCFRKAPDVSY